MTVLAVHGVLRAEDAPALDDLSPPLPVRPVVDGPLAAAVSDAPDRDLVPEDAVDHLDVLAEVAAQVAVVPLALGTAVADEEGVRDEVLRPRAEWFRQQLQALRDVVELRLDLAFDLDVAAARCAREPAVAALARTGRAPGAGLAARLALGEAVAQSVAERVDVLTEEWTQELTALAERATVLAADGETARLAFLVRRDRIPDADAAVARLRQTADAEAAIEYVGPLPAFSFLDEVESVASPPPASRWGW